MNALVTGMGEVAAKKNIALFTYKQCLVGGMKTKVVGMSKDQHKHMPCDICTTYDSMTNNRF